MQKTAIEQHNNCPVVIRWRHMCTGELRPGLFCQTHNHFLDWLKYQDACELIDEMGVKEEPWQVKKKSQRNKKAKPYLLKKKQNWDAWQRYWREHQ